MIKWGIMAPGTIAKKFAQTITQMDSNDVKLTAVASRSLDKAKEFASEYSIKHHFGSYEELCSCDDVDAIYIATPNNLHYECCVLALSHNKHVLCEKPFTTDAKQAEELYALAEDKGLFIMEALWTFHLPLLKKAAELIENGAIGDVHYITAEYGFTAEGKRLERKFRSDLAGGALLDVGVYNIGFVKMMLKSDPETIKTECILNEYGTDMFGTVLATYKNKRFASMTSSIGIKTDVEGVVYGTKGRIYFPNYQKAEYMKIIYNDGTVKEYKEPFKITGFEYQIEECCHCINQGSTESPSYTHKQSIEIMQTLDRIREKWDMKFDFEK